MTEIDHLLPLEAWIAPSSSMNASQLEAKILVEYQLDFPRI